MKNHKSLSTPSSLADLTLAEVSLRVLVWSMRSTHVRPHHSMDDLYTQIPPLLVGKVHVTSLTHTQIKAVYSTASLPRAEDNIHLCAQRNVCSWLFRCFSALQDTKLDLVEYSVLQDFFFHFPFSPFLF